jgi:hypothetical protein
MATQAAFCIQPSICGAVAAVSAYFRILLSNDGPPTLIQYCTVIHNDAGGSARLTLQPEVNATVRGSLLLLNWRLSGA